MGMSSLDTMTCNQQLPSQAASTPTRVQMGGLAAAPPAVLAAPAACHRRTTTHTAPSSTGHRSLHLLLGAPSDLIRAGPLKRLGQLDQGSHTWPRCCCCPHILPRPTRDRSAWCHGAIHPACGLRPARFQPHAPEQQQTLCSSAARSGSQPGAIAARRGAESCWSGGQELLQLKVGLQGGWAGGCYHYDSACVRLGSFQEMLPSGRSGQG